MWIIVIERNACNEVLQFYAITVHQYISLKNKHHDQRQQVESCSQNNCFCGRTHQTAEAVATTDNNSVTVSVDT